MYCIKNSDQIKSPLFHGSLRGPLKKVDNVHNVDEGPVGHEQWVS